MSLIFVESFDGIDTAALPARGWTMVATPAVSSVQARTGANALLVNAQTEYILKGVPAADDHATFIVGCAVYTTLVASSLIGFYSDGGATAHIGITVTATGALEARRFPGSGTVLGTSSAGVITANTWHYLEAKVTMHDTTGTVEIRVNGSTVLNLTGQDTKNGGTKAVFDSVIVGNNGTLGTPTAYFDDMYLCNAAGASNNTFIGDSKVRCLLPNGNGNSSQLLGSDANSTDNYLLVDEVPPSTVDFVGSGTDNQKDTYTFTDLPDASGTVVGIQISTYGLKTDAGSRSVALVTRSGGADYDSADLALPTPSPIYVFQVQNLNPATGVAWLRSEVNAAEFGTKIRP